MFERYLNECEILQQNCTITAEAHHFMAQSAKQRAMWLQVVPAALSAISGTIVAAGVDVHGLIFFTVAGATIAAVASVLNPNKEYSEQLAAAKAFTALKHDARFLRSAQSTTMPEAAFIVAVENLHDKYNELVKTLPPTNTASFERALAVVKRGLHDPEKVLLDA